MKIDWETIKKSIEDEERAFNALPRLEQLNILIKREEDNIVSCMFVGNHGGEEESIERQNKYKEERKQLLQEKD